MMRILCWFSCGAASAVATKLAMADNRNEVFERMSQMEQYLGRTVCKREWTENGKRKLERIPLRELPPDAGNYPKEPDIQCGIFCQMAEDEIAA